MTPSNRPRRVLSIPGRIASRHRAYKPTFSLTEYTNLWLDYHVCIQVPGVDGRAPHRHGAARQLNGPQQNREPLGRRSHQPPGVEAREDIRRDCQRYGWSSRSILSIHSATCRHWRSNSDIKGLPFEQFLPRACCATNSSHSALSRGYCAAISSIAACLKVSSLATLHPSWERMSCSTDAMDVYSPCKHLVVTFPKSRGIDECCCYHLLWLYEVIKGKRTSARAVVRSH
ncbi:hypothetical protein VTI28DRAFT_9321 [Corynascus sepedonium]